MLIKAKKSCNTTCQAAPEMQVEVECDCLRRIPISSKRVITFPKPCEWIIKTIEGEMTECPEVGSTLPAFDWDCDPRNETCAEGMK